MYERGFTFIPQAEIPIGKAIDTLLTFDGVDPDRLALLGISRELSEGLPSFTLEGMEAQITCPTLALAGEGDGAEFLGQAQEFFDLIASKTKRFRVFTAAEGAGAHCQADNPLLMNQELMAWLAEVFRAWTRDEAGPSAETPPVGHRPANA